MSGNSAGSFLILAVLALPILLIVFQRRAMKRQLAQVQDQLQLGAEVMTHSGAYGIVRALREDHVVLEMAPGVEMRWARAAVGRVVTPVEQDEPVDPLDRAPHDRLDPLGPSDDRPGDDPTDPRDRQS